MVKSLLKGIGDTKKVEKFYDEWSKNYEQSLIDWNYKAPRQSVNILNKYINIKKVFTLMSIKLHTVWLNNP